MGPGDRKSVQPMVERLKPRPAQIAMLARHLREDGTFFSWWD